MATDLSRLEPLFLSAEDYVVLGPDQFGLPGLHAREVLGPYARLQAIGPVLTVHDSVIEPRLGIAHHPHRGNERLFYILEGTMSHDDSLNGIKGDMPAGGLARLTEGRRGMIHQEWNHEDVQTRAVILVCETDPMPETASFAVLTDAEAPRYDAAPGVLAKELVGPRAQFAINSDVRLYTDNRFEAGATLDVRIGRDEGALILPLEGGFEVNGRTIGPPESVAVPPAADPRAITLRSTGGGRTLVVVFGPGQGLIMAER